MKNKVFYIILVVVITAGAGYSYKRLDFGRKTAIFFKIAFGDENTLMRMPPKKPPRGETGSFNPPKEGHESRAIGGRRGSHGPEGEKGTHGKPGMGKIISLRNVIPYAFILAFFIMVTRLLDISIRKAIRRRSSI